MVNVSSLILILSSASDIEVGHKNELSSIHKLPVGVGWGEKNYCNISKTIKVYMQKSTV